MSKKPLAVIPAYVRNKKDCEVTAYCVDSLLSTANVDVMVIDDGSPSAEWRDMLRKTIDSHVMWYQKAVNSGFSKTVNIGLKRAHKEGQDAILVNADIFFLDDNWLIEFRKGTEYVRGAKLIYPNGLIQHAGVYYSLIHRDFNHIYRFAPSTFSKAQNHRICPVTGALQYITWECLDEVGFYDENFSMSWEDVDYCLQVFQSGNQCEYIPTVNAIHYEAMFRGERPQKIKDWEKESWRYLHEKWNNISFAEWVPNMLNDD